jgi:hypothetical protein
LFDLSLCILKTKEIYSKVLRYVSVNNTKRYNVFLITLNVPIEEMFKYKKTIITWGTWWSVTDWSRGFY